MRALALCLLLVVAGPVRAGPPELGRVLAAAHAQVGVTVHYDGRYERLDYPGGDVPAERGLARGRPAVDAHHAARQAAFRAGRLQAGADREPSVGRVERGGDSP